MLKNKGCCITNEKNISTRLHKGPVFKVTHPYCELFKRSVMYVEAIYWNKEENKVEEKPHFKERSQ